MLEKLPIKTILSLFGTGFSYMVDGLGLAFTILLIMMTFDFVTGIMVAVVKKEVHSTIGLKGLIKKIYVIILIGSVYLLEMVVFDSTHVGEGITIAYIIIEFISIVENGGKLGVPIPNKLTSIIKQLKDTEIKKDENNK